MQPWQRAGDHLGDQIEDALMAVSTSMSMNSTMPKRDAVRHVVCSPILLRLKVRVRSPSDAAELSQERLHVQTRIG